MYGLIEVFLTANLKVEREVDVKKVTWSYFAPPPPPQKKQNFFKF